MSCIFLGVKIMPNDTNHLCHKIDTCKSLFGQLKSIILWLIQKCLNEIEWGNDLAKNNTLMIYNPFAWVEGIFISTFFFSFDTFCFDWNDSAYMQTNTQNALANGHSNDFNCIITIITFHIADLLRHQISPHTQCIHVSFPCFIWMGELQLLKWLICSNNNYTQAER